MAKIVIDDKTYEVNPEHNLLQECLSQGLDLPYFCWHPCMGSVGACRQCAVKQYRNAEDKTGMLVMACMTPASDGAVISIKDAQAQQFRANIIEGLMISHPHDCPVCEEGGECHLQDMTLMSGHNYRRYDKKKITHRNQYLGPFIGHEMNRCITCYRCTRFYNDYAGGTDLSAQASHHHVYFGRHQEGCLESEFSGNLVEVCPTGVFTDATFSAHYVRKWDLQTAPSVCVGCAVGCNTTPGERYGSLRRIVNRYNEEVNGYFLCDRGRFGYGFVNSARRMTASLERKGTKEQMLSDNDAHLKLLAAKQGNSIAIGSPRASLEANFALREIVGAENFYAGYSEREFELLQSVLAARSDARLHSPSIREIEEADAVLIVGEDVTNTAPRIALALRQSAQNRAHELAGAARIPLWQDAAVRELAQQEKSPVYILSGFATRLDDIAAAQYIDAPPGLTEVATAIGNRLDAKAPAISMGVDSATASLVEQIAYALGSANRPLIVSGISNGNKALLNAAINIAKALASKNTAPQNGCVDLCILLPEVNTLGMAMLMSGSKNSLHSALARMRRGELDNIIVLENDLYRRAAPGDVDAAFAASKNTLVMDQISTATTAKAHCVIATTSFAEQQGTYVNYEGRAQLSFQVYNSQLQARAAWSWLSSVMTSSPGFAELTYLCASTMPLLNGLEAVLPERGKSDMQVPRQPFRYSGRTAMIANLDVHEPKQEQDHESIMAFSMEGASHLKDSSIMAASWAPGWNSNQSISKFQDEVAGSMKGGNSGVLLPGDAAKQAGYLEVEQTRKGNSGLFELIHAYQIFGSEELSALAQPIQERSVPAFAAIALADAEALGVRTKPGIEIASGNLRIDLPLVLRKKIKPGTVVIYSDFTNCSPFQLGEFVSLQASRVQEDGSELAGLIISDRLTVD
jgi:NADH-quinone oxidoreductase subunit G